MPKSDAATDHLEQQNVRLPARTKRYLDWLSVADGKSTAQLCADVLDDYVKSRMPEIARMFQREADEAAAFAEETGVGSVTSRRAPP